VEGRERDEQKEGEKNHRDPVIPLEEAHCSFLIQSKEAVNPVEYLHGKMRLLPVLKKMENPARRHRNYFTPQGQFTE